ncbi:hypothetical protein B0T24DRAFT_627369 [Lasiosphaeria ovina]|uniref:Uncharacterized protein n=1 Tax=Lasiosphaeria ovina TaxID=92902 RepID=A0AAE0K6F5_9PEZI|nr:hypothetical protein B0T24DRAFT_627369 [Lasiosphaeria ovina]
MSRGFSSQAGLLQLPAGFSLHCRQTSLTGQSGHANGKKKSKKTTTTITTTTTTMTTTTMTATAMTATATAAVACPSCPSCPLCLGLAELGPWARPMCGWGGRFGGHRGRHRLVAASPCFCGASSVGREGSRGRSVARRRKGWARRRRSRSPRTPACVAGRTGHGHWRQ